MQNLSAQTNESEILKDKALDDLNPLFNMLVNWYAAWLQLRARINRLFKA